MMLIDHKSNPTKDDLKPFDIVVNMRGDRGIVSRACTVIRFIDHSSSGASTYGHSIGSYNHDLTYRSMAASYTIVERVRMPDINVSVKPARVRRSAAFQFPPPPPPEGYL